MKLKFCASVVSCGLSLLAGGLSAASLTWVPETGGALDEPSNWNAQEVKPEDALRIRKAQTGDVFLNNDLTVSGLNFGYAGVDVSATFNLGADRTLTLGSFYALTGSTLRVTSGTISVSGGQYFGHGGDNARVTIDGAGARYVNTADPSDSSVRLTLGYNGTCGNLLEVSNGGRLTSPVRIGHGGGSLNTFCVRGTGSVWDGSAAVSYVGYVSGANGNRIVIADGASATGKVEMATVANCVSNELVLCGAGTTWSRGSTDDFYLGSSEGADYTQFVVSNGVDYVADYAFFLGESSKASFLSEHNRILVASGAKLTTPNINFGGNSSSAEVVGNGSCLTVHGGDKSFLYPNRGTNNVIRLADGGRLVAGSDGRKPLYLHSGEGNGLDIDGGAFDLYGQLRQGQGIVGGVGTFVRVTNGGTFTAHGDDALYVGHEKYTSNHVFEVSNAGTFSDADVSAAGKKSFFVGNNGCHGNRLVVDNGTFDAKQTAVVIGYAFNDLTVEDGVGDNRAIVRNGGILNCYSLMVGRQNPNSRLDVENATVNIGTDFSASHEGSYAFASNAVVRVAGTNVSVTVSGTVSLSKTATLIVDVTGPQLTDAMLTASSFSFTEGSKIRITSSADLGEIEDFSATVLKSTNKDINLAKVSVEVDPDCGLQLMASDSKTLMVRHKLKRGLMLILR